MPLIRSASLNLFVEISVRIALLSAFCYMETMSPYFRVIQPTDLETSLKYPRHESFVPGHVLWSIVLAVPCVLSLLAWAVCNDCNDALEFLLAWSLALGMNGVITNMVKLIAGRPRPDFFYRCFPDGLETMDLQCTGDPDEIMDGRKSFPSGHSSLSFCSLGSGSLWLMGRLRALSRRRGGARLVAAGAPLALAAAVALSRSADYHHHWEGEFCSLGSGSLWLMGRLRALSRRRGGARLVAAGAPLALAAAVALSRSADYHHHWEGEFCSLGSGSLWLMGRLRALSRRRGGARLVAAGAPLALAAAVALSRSADYHHHWEGEFCSLGSGSLWLMGRLRALSRRRGGARLVAAGAPLALAAAVALSRSADYHHHWEGEFCSLGSGSLWLMGRLRALSRRRGGARLVAAGAPLALAAAVALSRSADYHHHWEGEFCSLGSGSLWLMGRLRALSRRRGGARLVAAGAPLALAAAVALSRSADYHHHWEGEFCSLGSGSLWLMGRLRALSRRRGGARLVAAGAPLALAAAVALSRSADYHHHWEGEFCSLGSGSLWLMGRLRALSRRRGGARLVAAGAPLALAAAVALSRSADYHHHWEGEFCSLGSGSLWLMGRLRALSRRRGGARLVAAGAPLALAAAVALSRSADYHHHWEGEFCSLGSGSLWLMGRLRALSRRRGGARLVAAGAPLALAAAVALSRSAAYHHHWEDILVGSVLGYSMALICYRQYYNPLSSDLAGVPYISSNTELAQYVNGTDSPSKERDENTPLLKKVDKWI